jgi:hypothetical protein
MSVIDSALWRVDGELDSLHTEIEQLTVRLRLRCLLEWMLEVLSVGDRACGE